MSAVTGRTMAERRQPPRWMSQTHERMLEYLAADAADRGREFPGPEGDRDWPGPSAIADEYDLDSTYVSRQAQRLSEAGFLWIPVRGVYLITDKGREFLDGDDFSDEPDPLATDADDLAE